MARKLARGTMLQRHDGEDPGNWVTVAQMQTIDGPDMTAEMFEFDDHDTAAGWVEKHKVKLDAGQVTGTVNFDPDDPTHRLLFDDLEEMAERSDYRVIYPLSDFGFSFEASVQALSPSAPSDQGLTAQVTWEVSGAPVLEDLSG